MPLGEKIEWPKLVYMPGGPEYDLELWARMSTVCTYREPGQLAHPFTICAVLISRGRMGGDGKLWVCSCITEARGSSPHPGMAPGIWDLVTSLVLSSLPS